MASSYDHKQIEFKWQAAWKEKNAFATPEVNLGDEKAYVLDFFPYPSGAGLHVGHLLGYTASDVIARKARMDGKKVLHPMGWDSFGLPAENYAIKSGVHPAISTAQNVIEFKRQFSQAGISYDWSKEMSTSTPEYYKWTQWMFSLLYERGLAYRKNGMVNWCEKDHTVLANEQVVNGRCERCDTIVIQKELRQWFFKITDYAERLLNDLDDLAWPEKIKSMQRNWIGKSEGAQLYFQVAGSEKKIELFTTRPDTVYGATYVVLAPEHPYVAELTTSEQQEAVKAYQERTSKSSELERTFLDREKTGVFTGSYAVNPATGKNVPIWIADYVLSTYGTGAIMAVPAHDERDFEFAGTFGLEIVQVIESGESPLPFTAKGILMNSGDFAGKKSEEAVDGILAQIGGERKITYRLRDWLVSRQRFWGSPIPIAYDSQGTEHLLPQDQLPVELPMDVEFLPTGQSPLAIASEWRKYVDPASGETWEREADTLDTFVCSSWYYLRFPTPQLETAAFDKEAVKNWLPVDMYIGGAEHAVLHLLYARFFTKVLFDAGYLDFEEPFTHLKNPGMILGPDNNKMSKSKGNVINPDDVVSEFGADTLRLYELFMAPFELEKPWNTKGILGVRRFLEKIWRLQDKVGTVAPSPEELTIIHRTIKKVTGDITDFRFNTAVSSMMEAVNGLSEFQSISKETYVSLITILNPFAPHITEELWQLSGQEGLCSLTGWPSYSEEYIVQSTVEYPIQINGKVRAKITVEATLNDADLLALVKEEPKVQEALAKGSLVKEIVVPGRLVSLVIS
jgi:leucyl-tRNA synthetase